VVGVGRSWSRVLAGRHRGRLALHREVVVSAVDELITWLRAQLDDDERVAREAGDDSLRWRSEGPERNLVDEIRTIAIAPYEGELHEAEHIARWDPARVLAEVEAKRRVLDWLVDCENKALDGNWWNLEVRDAVEALAQPYAGRPGWREEWATTR
jgi:hypothetical protein